MSHMYESQRMSNFFKVQVKSLTAGKTNKYETIMWKMALKRLPNVGLENERLGWFSKIYLDRFRVYRGLPHWTG